MSVSSTCLGETNDSNDCSTHQNIKFDNCQVKDYLKSVDLHQFVNDLNSDIWISSVS